MISNIGPGMLILIAIAALIIFGPKRLPELGKAFGATLREFKKGSKEIFGDDDSEDSKIKELQDAPMREEQQSSSRL